MTVTVWKYPKRDEWKAIMARPQMDLISLSRTVSDILESVRCEGDDALRRYEKQFDRVVLDALQVTPAEMEEGVAAVPESLKKAIRQAIDNIRKFHASQAIEVKKVETSPGVWCWQKPVGIEKVGLYVPGGTAAYPSSVIMNAVPAKIAGVKEIIMVTPPRKDGTPNPDILIAAALCGVDRIFLSGGAQAIAALAYGTKEIPKVDKIVGPGNIYVATAKKLLYGIVDIDMIAGPSEVLVMADETANPAFAAADLMSQAEHDVMASSILVTTSEKLAEQVQAEINRQVQTLERKEIIEKSMNTYGAILLCNSREEATALANRVAPEHLEVLMENPMELLGALDNAGSVFLGQYASEPLGDYYAGPNHVLPTSGTARFFSPLGVASFTKRSSYTYYTKDALRAAKDDIVLIANREGLTAHANAITVRFEDEKE